MATLQAAHVEAVLDAQTAAQAALTPFRTPTGNSDMVFQPAHGGALLPEAPIVAIRGGLSADVPVLCGTNLDETTLWGFPEVEDERLLRVATRIFGDGGAEALATYRRSRPDLPPPRLMLAMTTDQMFRIPAIRLAEAHAGNGGRNWSYLFSWPSRAMGGRLGATHALEIPFTFNNLHQPGIDAFLGKGGPDPQPLADVMHDAWIAFVKHGDPGWSPYDTERRSVMEFGEKVDLREDPYGPERELWNGQL